jgi:hypothetical protein
VQLLPWLFEPGTEPPTDLSRDLQRNIIAMLRESFSLFAVRLGLHFTVKWGTDLMTVETPHPHIRIIKHA